MPWPNQVPKKPAPQINKGLRGIRDIGDFKRYVTIQSVASVSDGAGGSTVTNTTVFSAWAEITQKMRVAYADDEWRHYTDYIITMRYDSRVVPQMQLTDENGKLFRIYQVFPLDMVRGFMHLYCEELHV